MSPVEADALARAIVEADGEPSVHTLNEIAAKLCDHFIRPQRLVPTCHRGEPCLCWHEKALPAALDVLEIATRGAHKPEPEDQPGPGMRVTGGAV